MIEKLMLTFFEGFCLSGIMGIITLATEFKKLAKGFGVAALVFGILTWNMLIILIWKS